MLPTLSHSLYRAVELFFRWSEEFFPDGTTQIMEITELEWFEMRSNMRGSSYSTHVANVPGGVMMYVKEVKHESRGVVGQSGLAFVPNIQLVGTGDGKTNKLVPISEVPTT